MKKFSGNFDINNIHSVELNLFDGQVDLILRALELYGYNLSYMLNSTDFFKDDLAQEKQALLNYTYEQVMATKAEQIEIKQDTDTYNMPEFSKILLKDSIKDNELEFKLNVG